jgi:hypothetical protein
MVIFWEPGKTHKLLYQRLDPWAVGGGAFNLLTSGTTSRLSQVHIIRHSYILSGVFRKVLLSGCSSGRRQFSVVVISDTDLCTNLVIAGQRLCLSNVIQQHGETNRKKEGRYKIGTCSSDKNSLIPASTWKVTMPPSSPRSIHTCPQDGLLHANLQIWRAPRTALRARHGRKVYPAARWRTDP